ncbi:MAG: hypothetical protein JJE21_02250 [Spirochaetaceae bacterium]|nr:hypothetical protein [Spirochaetaceae bacterium]
MMNNQTPNWGKLDNTAHLFPVISTKKTSNVFRESVSLYEEVIATLLQEAVEKTLQSFPGFAVHLKRGLFWYYLEENPKPFPIVAEEDDYPCRLIDYKKNNEYLFSVSYYKDRINLETFHALADGVGAKVFLKALIYNYLNLSHDEINEIPFDQDISLEREDGFQQCYTPGKISKSNYSTLNALHINGRKLFNNGLSVIEGSLSVKEIKSLAKSLNVSINVLLVATYAYAIYLTKYGNKKPIVISVPVDLRFFFNSSTTKNFFSMANANFIPTKDDYSFEEVVEIVKNSLIAQITKENFRKTISYNVSNEQGSIVKGIPLVIKNIGIKYTYAKAAKASTTTMSNLGVMKFKEPYNEYVNKFSAMLPMSIGQNIKAAIASHGDLLSIIFTSSMRNSKIQKEFFRILSHKSIKIRIVTNGENNVSL